MPAIHAQERPAPEAAAEAGLPDLVDVDADERLLLLRVAWSAVSVASGAAASAVLEDALSNAKRIARRAAAFVTLTEDGELRGCMGSLDSRRLVVESVTSAAAFAATEDPRFRPVAREELSRLELEVSVLGPLVRLTDPEHFRLGIDGLIVERGPYRGLLLPEVATMLGCDRMEMLETTCRKAGLPRDAWRQPQTTIHAFRTARFGGPAEGGTT